MLQEFRDTENLKENFDQNKRMRQVIEIIRNQDFWFDFFLKKIITTYHTLEHFYNALPPLINSSFVPYKIHSVRRVYLTFFPLPPVIDGNKIQPSTLTGGCYVVGLEEDGERKYIYT